MMRKQDWGWLIFWVIVAGALVGILLVHSARAAGRKRGSDTWSHRIEGCHVWEGEKYLAVACTNCLETPGADYVRGTCYLRHPPEPGVKGYMSACYCSYHDSDLLIGLPPGAYDVAVSTCAAGTPYAPLRAVVTRWQISEQEGGGDGGCDMEGPACTPGLECVEGRRPKPKARVRLGRLVVDAHGKHTMRWDQPR